jgi:hypothetical protein
MEFTLLYFNLNALPGSHGLPHVPYGKPSKLRDV